VFNNKEDPTTPSYLTSMTKALFKDGSAQNAVTFFVQGVEKMRDLKAKREDLLVSLFDAAYAEETTP